MSTKTVQQKVAREVQDRTGCSYSFALMQANSKEISDAAKADASEKPFRHKLAYAILKKMNYKDIEKYEDTWKEG